MGKLKKGDVMYMLIGREEEFVLRKTLLRLNTGEIVHVEASKNALCGEYFGQTEVGRITYTLRPFYQHDLSQQCDELLITTEKLGGLTIGRSEANEVLFNEVEKIMKKIFTDGGHLSTHQKLLQFLMF